MRSFHYFFQGFSLILLIGSSSSAFFILLNFLCRYAFSLPCVDCASPIFLVQRLFLFVMDASHNFPQSVLAIIPLIGGVIGVVTVDCTGCWVGPPLCFMTVTALLGVGAVPQLLE